MIILVVSISCTLYFIYLYKWVKSRLLEEYQFGSPSPPKSLPHSINLSILIGTVWGITIIAGIFWGFTYNRYSDYLAIRDNQIEIIFLVVIVVALSLSFVVIYHLGEIKGITTMKSTELFRRHMNN